MVVSAKLSRIFASAPVDEFFYETLEISHPQFTRTYYITNAAKQFNAYLETGPLVTFELFPFQVKLPESGSNGFQDIGIVLSNIDRRLVDELERASNVVTTPINFTYRAYASTDLTSPGLILPRMSASEVLVELTTVSAQASMVDLVNRDFPNELYTPNNFPMLLNTAG